MTVEEVRRLWEQEASELRITENIEFSEDYIGGVHLFNQTYVVFYPVVRRDIPATQAAASQLSEASFAHTVNLIIELVRQNTGPNIERHAHLQR